MALFYLLDSVLVVEINGYLSILRLRLKNLGLIVDIIEELLSLTQAYDEAGVGYAVCGGLAVTIHGRPRLTIDIDLVIPKSVLDNAIEVSATVGFDLKSGWVTLPENDFGIDRLYRLTKTEGSEFLTLDLLEADSADNRLFANRENVSLGDRHISVLSKSSLIEMKSRSTRTKDKLDIEILQDESN